MTKDEALKMALHVIQHQGDVDVDDWIAAEKAIKEALAEQDAEAHLQAVADFGQLQEQEPVAWWDAKIGVFNEKHFDQLQPLYASPPKRQPEPCMCGETYRLGVVHRKDTPCFDYIEHVWIGLTDDEIKAIVGPWGSTEIKGYTRTLFDQIEAALKEKNT